MVTVRSKDGLWVLEWVYVDAYKGVDSGYRVMLRQTGEM
jgi:hypothetical protein